VLVPLTVLLLTAGCAPARSARSRPLPEPALQVQARTSVLREGTSGREVPLSALDRVIARNDVIAFGEYHDQADGARLEAVLWERLTTTPPPGGRSATLAMEFLERDVQADVDAYLAGQIDEATFVKRARQGPGYAATHRALVERAKATGRPVIAANAPRRLVTAYRKQDAAYADWKATLPEADRGWLPSSTRTIDDLYRARFVELMGEERGATFFKAQSLWDDAMAEAVADRRAKAPNERVLLIVGGFHVEGRLGTLTKLAERRPQDRVGLIVMAYGEDAALSLPADVRGQADLVLVVRKPEETPRVQPAKTPAKAPAGSPSAAPAATAPGSAPAQPPVPPATAPRS
jgi:uncharacterized iron-regulated protein